MNLSYAYVYCAYEFSCEVTRTNIARMNFVARSVLSAEFLKQFSFEQLVCLFEKAHQLLKVLCRLEFTVLPSLKCLGRIPFHLPLTNSASLKFFKTDLAIVISSGKSPQTIGAPRMVLVLGLSD